ncbi:hypothetical protein ACH4FX_38960 [Streptomyces sp. NPDC018019]|uniref:hypothetical protein n=1 Tax=Streptomyces sp. NPDC018019 TaxID=3365030 RepID=UPI00379B6BAE
MSARDDILAGLRASEGTAIGDASPEEVLDRYRAEVLREAADAIAAPVPPVEAGPRTERERGRMEAVAELRRMADEAGGPRA